MPAGGVPHLALQRQASLPSVDRQARRRQRRGRLLRAVAAPADDHNFFASQFAGQRGPLHGIKRNQSGPRQMNFPVFHRRTNIKPHSVRRSAAAGCVRRGNQGRSCIHDKTELNMLHGAGLLSRERRGAQVFYAISEPLVMDICEAACRKLYREAVLAPAPRMAFAS